MVENHRADGPNIAECREVREVEGLLVDKESPCENQRVPTSPHKMESSQKAESKQPTRRGKIKWPKVNKAEAWHKLDVDLIKVLKGSLRGGGESKLKLLGTSLPRVQRQVWVSYHLAEDYSCTERKKREGAQSVSEKVMTKKWRKATLAEKEGLKALWEEVRQKPASLCRAERVHKCRKQKEKETTNFFKVPFKRARQLL